jgi:hypothetical protein
VLNGLLKTGLPLVCVCLCVSATVSDNNCYFISVASSAGISSFYTL